MRPKHPKDQNNGKNGYVGGNPRYGDNERKGKHPKRSASYQRRLATEALREF